MGRNLVARNDSEMPKIIPAIPPVTVRTTASIRNCVRISLLFAPIAFSNPISLVRSVTVTSIIFIIPIPPTTSEIAAIPASSAVSKLVTLFTMERASFELLIVKSASAGSVILC